MDDRQKTKAQLIAELRTLRQRPRAAGDSPPGVSSAEREVLSRLSLALVECEGVEDMGAALSAACDDLFDFDAFFIDERVGEESVFRTIRSEDLVDGRRTIWGEELNNDSYHEFELLHEGRGVLINRRENRVEKEPPLKPFGNSPRPSASLMFAPIAFAGTLHGVVSVQSYTPDRYDDSDLERLTSIAGLVAPVLRRIRAEQAILASQSRYRRAIAQADAVPYEYDYETNELVYVGEEIERLTGYTPREIMQSGWRRLVQEITFPDGLRHLSVGDAVAHMKAGDQPSWRADYRILTRDGRERWVADASIPLFGLDGKPSGTLGILQDITERKRSERLLSCLSDLGGKLNGASDAAEAARFVADAADSLLGWDSCLVRYYSEKDRKVYRLLTIDTVNGERTVFADDPSVPCDPGILTLKTVREGPLLVNPGLTEMNEYASSTFGQSDQRSQSMLFTPIRDPVKGVVGVLSIQSYSAGKYDSTALTTLQLLADLCGSAVQRTRAQDALRESEQRYRRAIAQADAVPYQKDYETLRMTYIGEGIQRLTGYTPEEFTPEVWRSIVKETVLRGECAELDSSEAYRKTRSGAIATWQADYRIQTRDGEERWISDTSINLYDGSGKTYGSLGILQDITERMRTLELNKALSELGRRLNAASNPKEVGLVVADLADRLIGWDACYIHIYAEEGNRVFPVLNMDTVDGVRGEFPSLYDDPRPPTPMLEKTLREGPQLVLRSGSELADPQDLVAFGRNSRRSASLLFVPIRQKGSKNVGCLSIQSYAANAYDQEDVDLLQTLADHCTGAMERAFAEFELHTRRQEATLFASLASRLNEIKTQKEAAQVIAEAAKSLLGWDAFELRVFCQKTNRITDILNYDTVDGERREFPPLFRNAPLTAFAARVVREGAFLILRDPSSDPTGACDTPGVAFGNTDRRSASIMYVPMRKGDRLIGILSIQSYTPRAYTKASLSTFQALADHCGGAMERIQAEKEAEDERRRHAVFAELGRKLSAAATPHDAAVTIMRTAEEFIEWDACHVNLYSAEDNLTYAVLFIDSIDGKKSEHSPRTPSGSPTPLAKRAIERGGFLLLRHLDKGSAPDETGFPFGDQNRLSASILFVPARKGDTVVGTLSVQSYTPNAYTEQDLSILQALADHCAGALERIRIEKSLADERRRLAAFAELGRQLNATSTPHDAGRLIVDLADTLIGWDSCLVLLYSGTENVAVPLLAMDLVDGRRTEVSTDHFLGIPSANMRKVVREGKRLILRTPEELAAANDTRPFGDKARRSASLMYVPVRRGPEVLGILSIQSYRFNAYTRADLDLLASLAEHCGGALERIQAQQNVRASEERYALAVRGASDGIWDWDLAANEIYLSPRWKQILGYSETEIGQHPDEWFRRVHPQDHDNLRETLHEHIDGKTDQFQHENRVLAKTGEYIWVLCRGVAVRDPSGHAVRIAGSMIDVTARKLVEERLAVAAFHDTLTGLPNRALFTDRLERCLARSRRKPGYRFAVLFIDLDRFKMVNDSLGHRTGDILLQSVGDRLRRCIREGDTIARIGGDEFTILLDDLGEANQAVRVAERILQEIAVPFDIEGSEIFSGASIGIAFNTPEYHQASEILRDADAALYRAKEDGRGRYIVFDEKIHKSVLATLEVERDLRDALARGELRLRFQPEIAVKSGELQGFEALVRWQHPEKGLLTPSHFMQVAEESGLIVPLGEWVLRESCRQIAEWRQRFPKPNSLFVCVNLSARQFSSPALGPLVEELLGTHGLPAEALRLAISETAILKESTRVTPILSRWRRLGIRIVLDDFGTGYSPLGHLMGFPVDSLKIHRSLVGALENSAESDQVVRAVVSLAKILHLSVVAEGTETEAQMNTLRELQCECAQGHYIAKPLTAEEAEKFLAGR